MVRIIRETIRNPEDIIRLEENIQWYIDRGYEVKGYSVTVISSYNEIHNVIMIKKEK